MASTIATAHAVVSGQRVQVWPFPVLWRCLGAADPAGLGRLRISHGKLGRVSAATRADRGWGVVYSQPWSRAR
ncbi:MAG: hypothetical protein ACRDQ1_17515, partial [Sciscionella sp.]